MRSGQGLPGMTTLPLYLYRLLELNISRDQPGHISPPLLLEIHLQWCYISGCQIADNVLKICRHRIADI